MISKTKYLEAKETIRQYLNENEKDEDYILTYTCIPVIDVVSDFNGDDIMTDTAKGYAARIIDRFLES